MRTTILLLITVLCICTAASAQNRILWDGESANASTCNKAYGAILSGPDAHGGSFYFRAERDPSHAPRLGFNCTKMWRSDISGYDELRFYIKSNLAGQSTSVRFTTYYAQSKWVSLESYVSGGVGTDYQLVKIPLQEFKTANYDLGSIEHLEFSPGTAGTYFYIDDIEAADTGAPAIRFEPVSSRVAKLIISERVDTTVCYNAAIYSITSSNDPDFQQTKNPAKVGRHYYVTGLKPQSGSAIVASELFLVFDQTFKNGQTYQLHVVGLADLSGNVTDFDTTFTFSDETISGNVKVNQVGYLPAGPKLGKLGNFLGDAWFLPVPTSEPVTFKIVDTQGQTAFSGNATHLKEDAPFSGEDVFELDFSAFTTPGEYHIYVPGYGRSETFRIGADVYNTPYFHTARALFYQRTDALPGAHAQEWARGGLPATTAEIHSSHTASPLYSATDLPPGTAIPMTKGWLDAGDYGRYVPTAASALFILFTAFELYPKRFPDKHLDIPESGNNIPDLIDELKYETDWLLQMQAPDGGVYFRVTPAKWSTGLPEEETNTLFVSEKTTQSTAMFAAAMAVAYRNFKPYFPLYADLCLAAAEKAWVFLQAHPQASAPVNVQGISAGPYPDPEDRDNRAWAAAELYKSTGNAAYHTDFLSWYNQIPHEFQTTMSWQQHTFKAAWAYATTKHPTDASLIEEFRNTLTNDLLINYFQRTMETHAYHGAYHPFRNYIGYGTFGMAQSYAFDYIMFSHLLSKPELLDLAKIQLDIPLGNNPLSQSFITGLGAKKPKYPLHWSTVGNHYNGPVPGVPVFGPAASLVMNRPSSIAIQDSTNRYPYGFKKEGPYPVLRRYTDAREAVEMSEFTVQEIAVTAAAFAFFSSVESQPLPVRLSSFEATTRECRTELRWSTAGEQHADYFAIERSDDARKFVEVARVRAAGDTQIPQQYTFTDTLAGSNNYYRLKQTDFDGTFSYSKTVFAKNPCSDLQVRIGYLQPDWIEIHVKSSTPQNLACTLYKLDGLAVQEENLKAGSQNRMNVSGLSPGVYILGIHNETQDLVYSEKVLIGISATE